MIIDYTCLNNSQSDRKIAPENGVSVSGVGEGSPVCTRLLHFIFWWRVHLAFSIAALSSEWSTRLSESLSMDSMIFEI